MITRAGIYWHAGRRILSVSRRGRLFVCHVPIRLSVTRNPGTCHVRLIGRWGRWVRDRLLMCEMRLTGTILCETRYVLVGTVGHFDRAESVVEEEDTSFIFGSIILIR